MKKNIVITILIFLFVLTVFLVIATVGYNGDTANQTGKGESNVNKEPEITSRPEDIPFINAALRSYFLLKDGEELTDEMLSEVKSISISPAIYGVNREGYYLLDVYINGDKEYGGVLERRIEKARLDVIFDSVRNDPSVPQLVMKRFDAFYSLKDPGSEILTTVIQQMLEQYPESAHTPLYVLAKDLKFSEASELVDYFYKYTNFFEMKFFKIGEAIDGELLSCYTNLETVTTFGIEIENPPEGVEVKVDKYRNVTYINSIEVFGKYDLIERIEIQNSHDSYVLTYDPLAVNGETEGYESSTLMSIIDQCVRPFYDNCIITDDLQKYKLDKASEPAKYTLVLKNGVEYTVLVSGDGNFRMFEGDDRVYPCNGRDGNLLKRSLESLKKTQ